jgi:hypothetical protein
MYIDKSTVAYNLSTPIKPMPSVGMMGHCHVIVPLSMSNGGLCTVVLHILGATLCGVTGFHPVWDISYQKPHFLVQILWLHRFNTVPTFDIRLAGLNL